jgi:hypothetical protein
VNENTKIPIEGIEFTAICASCKNNQSSTELEKKEFKKMAMLTSVAEETRRRRENKKLETQN